MERKEFLEKVLAYGRQAGFADCEVYYRGGKAFEVLILEGEVSDYENSREEGLAFRGNINGRTGYVYTEQLTEDAAKKQAIQRLYAYEEKLIEKGVQISENNVKIEIKHQDCVSRGSLTVIEKTGKEGSTERKTQPKERTPEDG